MGKQDHFEDPSGRYRNLIVELCNVYAQNKVSHRKDYFENLANVLKRDIPTVIGGDFNSIEDIFLDKNGGDQDLAVTALRALQNLVRHFNLTDVFRNMNPSTREFTWNSADCSVSCRLDRFYISGDILENCNSWCITYFPYSNHDAVQMSFQTQDSLDRGPGVWKFNTTVL